MQPTLFNVRKWSIVGVLRLRTQGRRLVPPCLWPAARSSAPTAGCSAVAFSRWSVLGWSPSQRGGLASFPGSDPGPQGGGRGAAWASASSFSPCFLGNWLPRGMGLSLLLSLFQCSTRQIPPALYDSPPGSWAQGSLNEPLWLLTFAWLREITHLFSGQEQTSWRLSV